LAAKRNSTEIVKLLLSDKRVDPSVSSNVAIQEAAIQGNLEMFNLLFTDPRVDPSDKENVAIQLACELDHPKIVSQLLQDPRVDPTEDSNYALFAAAHRGFKEVIQILINSGKIDSSVFLQAAEIAEKQGHQDVVQFLQNPKNNQSEGKTAQHTQPAERAVEHPDTKKKFPLQTKELVKCQVCEENSSKWWCSLCSQAGFGYFCDQCNISEHSTKTSKGHSRIPVQ